GRRVVFLIDRSSSMKGKRFQLAKEHLIAFIGDLDSGVEFSVIFYNNIHEVAPFEGLQRRSDTLVSEISEWIDSQSARGGTNILTPVVNALEMEPDTIFLLSDGEFEERVPSDIDRMNVEGVKINTISLHVASDSLEKIAAESGGEYRFVSP
ncbi:MAG: VWA domain-containing protein, partial [Verrucomicrobiales bacterium]|nr:VWA domain-containing protein [Verrucomicrobiales bacterium]